MSKKMYSAILLTFLLTTVLPISGVQIHEARASGYFLEPDWTKTYGGTSDDRVPSVIQTSDGGYALAGRTKSYGAGDDDFWLVKTDSAGNAEWTQTYGGIGSDAAWSVIQTFDGGYALGGWISTLGINGMDAWLVKTDWLGNMEWSTTYGGIFSDVAWSVVQTSDEGYALGGETGSYGAGSVDFWLIKTDSAGNVEWNNTYGGTNIDRGSSLITTTDGGYALAGETMSYGAGSLDFWLVKTDSAGNKQWSKTYGGTGYDIARSVIQTSDGGYALAGSTNSYGAGSSDAWFVKTNSAGKMLLNATYGGWTVDAAYSIVQTTVDGGYVLAGETKSYGAGGLDFWLIKLTPRTTYIRADGSIDPSSAPIQRNGDLYTLTDNIYSLSGIVIQRNNTTFDGNRYTLHGSGSAPGIYCQSVTNVTIKNTNIKCCNFGIIIGSSLCSSSGNTVSGNNVTDNTSGIVVSTFSNDNIVSGNNIVNNTEGVSLHTYSSNNTVSGNNIADNTHMGVYVYQSSGNIVSGNNIARNNRGVQITYSSGNYFHHNNFIDNPQQVNFLTSYANSWDDSYPSGGNYWSDYVGADVYMGQNQSQPGSDAIGDDPYVIDLNNQDRYPLMGPFSTTTETGDNVAVFPHGKVALVFEKILEEGKTRVKEFNGSPPPPPERALVGPYYDIKTTAYYSDMIMIRIIYNDTGLTPEQESSLQLTHWLLFGDVTGETADPYEFVSDGQVDIKDIAIIAKYFGQNVPAAPPECDISSSTMGTPDGKIDIKDIALAAKNFGQTAQPTDITTYIDTASNIIYGETDHLSIIGVTRLR